MPLTPKQERQKRHIEDTYGSKKKGDSVFYAMENSGKISGQKRHKRRHRKSKRK